MAHFTTVVNIVITTAC